MRFNSHLKKISVVHSDRPERTYLKPSLPGDQARCGKAAPGINQGHRYLDVPDPRRTVLFASKRRHPDYQNPPLLQVAELCPRSPTTIFVVCDYTNAQ